MLAAGRGTRYDASWPAAKLLAPLHGRPLLEHVLAAMSRAQSDGVIDDVVAVVPPGDDPVAELARAGGARTAVNRTAELGLSSSIRRGLAALDERIGAAILALGDQPMIRPDVLARLAELWRAERPRLIRPRYAATPDAPGHPVLVDRSVWRLAQRLEGDAGFASLLGPGSAGVLVLDVPGGNPDVDTPADLHTLEGSSS